MPRQKRPSRRAKETVPQKGVGRFDDALPLSLQTAPAQTSRIKLHKEGGVLSPYIVRLARQNAPASLPVAADPIATLKAHLLAQADLLAEAETAGEEESLEVDFQDLASQFAESDRQFAPTPNVLSISREAPSGNKTSSVNAASVVNQLVEMPFDASDLFQTGDAKKISASALPATSEPIIDLVPDVLPEPIEQLPTEPVALEEEPIVLTFSRPTEALLEDALTEHAPLDAPSTPSGKHFWLSLRFPDRVAVRAFATFLLFSFLFVLPLHAMQGFTQTHAVESNISEAGQEAVNAIVKGASALQDARFDVAGDHFDQATTAFSYANTTLNDMNAAVATVASLLPQTSRTLTSTQGLVKAGQELSESAEIFAAAGEDLSHQSSAELTTKLAILSAYIAKAKPHMEAAKEALSQVDASVIPDSYQEKVKQLTQTVPALSDSLDEFSSFATTLQTILGSQQKMRYLLAFQNDAEIRPTGGFIGSYAQIDVLHGAIVNMEVPGGGTYDVQGQLSAFVEPPAPITLVDPRWEFQDANWFPDFPTSASKLLWFYSKAGGPTVDGVIAVNARLMPDILAILGPIDMPAYNRTIDSENFLFETEKMVERDYVQYQDVAGTQTASAPKQFLSDLAPKLLERVQASDASSLLAIMQRLGQGLSEKDIQIYFTDNALESQMTSLGWSGDIKQTSGDSLMVVDTNLGGGKTDSVISQDVDLQVHIEADGTITNTVTLTKTHHGLGSALFEGMNNVDYVRFYVPQGSTLLHAEGFTPPPAAAFETTDLPLTPDADLQSVMSHLTKDAQTGTDIWDEEGKTVFGNWIQVAPGKTTSVSFTYTLPFKIQFAQDTGLLAEAKARLGIKNLSDYTLLVQKQSGVARRTTTVHLSLPAGDQVTWSSLDGNTQGDITLTNDRDVFASFLLERKP